MMTTENKKTILPEHIIDFFIKKHDSYPCITQTRNVKSKIMYTFTQDNERSKLIINYNYNKLNYPLCRLISSVRKKFRCLGIVQP